MNRAIVIIVLGILLFLVSLLADILGFGVEGMGQKQIAGAVIGVVVAIVGGALHLRGGSSADSA